MRRRRRPHHRREAHSDDRPGRRPARSPSRSPQRRYVFKLAPNAADTAGALTAELTRRNIRKVALLHSADSYGQEGLTALRGEFDKANIRPVRVEAVRPTDTDLDAARSRS